MLHGKMSQGTCPSMGPRAHPRGGAKEGTVLGQKHFKQAITILNCLLLCKLRLDTRATWPETGRCALSSQWLCLGARVTHDPCSWALSSAVLHMTMLIPLTRVEYSLSVTHCLRTLQTSPHFIRQHRLVESLLRPGTGP